MSDRKKIRSFTFSGSSRSLAERAIRSETWAFLEQVFQELLLLSSKPSVFATHVLINLPRFARFARSDRLILPFANQSVSDSLYTRKHYRVAVSKPGKYISIFAVRKVFDFAVPSCV